MSGEALARRGLWTRVMAFLGLEEEDEGREPVQARLVPLPGGRTARPPSPQEGSPGPRPSVISLVQPRTFEEAQEMVDRLRRRGPVVVQLDRADRESAQRILNFLGGALYALDGTLYVLGPGIYLAAPGGVHVNDLRGEEP